MANGWRNGATAGTGPVATYWPRGVVPEWMTKRSVGRSPLRGGGRLDTLFALLVDPPGGVPALLRAAVVHGELLALRPFAGPSGVVARAAARLTLIADGLDRAA